MPQPLPGLWAPSLGELCVGPGATSKELQGGDVQTTLFEEGKMGYQLEFYRGESLNLGWRDGRGCAGWSSGGGHP